MTAGSPAERVVSIASHPSLGDSNCSSGVAWDSRADVDTGWVRTSIAAWLPTCSQDREWLLGCVPEDLDCYCVADNVCDARCPALADDPDCPKECGAGNACALVGCPKPDPDCGAPEGSPCSLPTHCTSPICVGDPQHLAPYCSRSCSRSADCLLDMECVAGRCVFKQLPIVSDGGECRPLSPLCYGEMVCTGSPNEPATCRLPCDADADCGRGICVAGGYGEHYCQPPPVTLPSAADELPGAASCAQAGGLAALWLLVAFGLLLPKARPPGVRRA